MLLNFLVLGFLTNSFAKLKNFIHPRILQGINAQVWIYNFATKLRLKNGGYCFELYF